ncbi:MAG: uridine kinase [Lachnospiraceae bacterium]|nr:uridine kinase [Lachnospiraceae bacterium]
MKTFKTLSEKLKALLSERKIIAIAIDGRAGAGKSTLADSLAREFNGAVIRMDHFFLPPDLRGKARVNVHYERFLVEVYPFIKKGIPFSYRIFDCSLMDYHGINRIEVKPLLIVEGAYSLLPMWDEIFDLRIFYDIDEAKQRERIILRNGASAYQNFKEKWIPLEEAYFLEYHVRERCDLVLP